MKKITRFLLVLAAFVASGTMANAINTECAGTDTQAAQGSFTLGYNYTFSTSGTSVTFTCECLDAKTGLVAYAWTYNPGFAEVQMTQGTGQIFSKTFTGQTIGATFTVACKFAYAGGMAVTKTFTYTVGNACAPQTDFTKPVMGTAVVVGTPTVSAVNLTLTATDDVTSPVTSFVANDAANGITNKAITATAGNATVTGLAASTSYNLTITAKDAAGNISDNSVVASFTTASHPIAPTPSVVAANVIGIYSDAYACVANTFQWWAASSSSDLVQGGNNFKLITSTNCFGTQVTALQDISSMKYLHVDIYPTTCTTIQIGIVTNPGGEQHPANTLVANQWNSFNILLADLKTGKPALDLTKLTQVGFWGMNGTFYFDNLYFWKDLGTSVSEVTTANGISYYPNPIANQLTVNAKSEISQVVVRNLVGQSVKTVIVNGLQQSIDLSNVSAGNYLVTVKLANGQLSTQKLVKL
jgi:hypothetical protein